MFVSLAADDPDACTRFSVTVTPEVVAPHAVAESVGDVVAGCIGPERREDVVLAVEAVLADTVIRDLDGELTVRVRQRDDRTEIELRERSAGPVRPTGPLAVAREHCDRIFDEVTDAGHLIRLVYASAP